MVIENDTISRALGRGLWYGGEGHGLCTGYRCVFAVSLGAHDHLTTVTCFGPHWAREKVAIMRRVRGLADC